MPGLALEYQTLPPNYHTFPRVLGLDPARAHSDLVLAWPAPSRVRPNLGREAGRGYRIEKYGVT